LPWKNRKVKTIITPLSDDKLRAALGKSKRRDGISISRLDFSRATKSYGRKFLTAR
jgi:hypothetical protein